MLAGFFPSSLPDDAFVVLPFYSSSRNERRARANSKAAAQSRVPVERTRGQTTFLAWENCGHMCGPPLRFLCHVFRVVREQA